MILPTIIGVTEAALRAVPRSYYEGSLALGATQERSIFRVMLPAAKSGVLAGVVLGIGRAIGETMAVVMVAGNQARMPAGNSEGSPYHDNKHRSGDGICGRSAQRCVDRYRRSTVRIHPDH